jgi:hypothetical protein
MKLLLHYCAGHNPKGLQFGHSPEIPNLGACRSGAASELMKADGGIREGGSPICRRLAYC